MIGWSTQLRRFGLSLAAMLLCYTLYSWIAVPWIEGPPKKIRAVANPIQAQRASVDANLALWLPADAWELQPCKRLDTNSGHIFFQDYQPHDDGRVEVQPLTIVFLQSGESGDEPPIIIRAPEGAVLKFDRPLTLGGRAGQLEGGMLHGGVSISRGVSATDGSSGWSLATSEIQISNQRIQTIQDVEFRFGLHAGSGRHLIVDLATDPLRGNQKSLSVVEAARSIELVQVKELRLAQSQAVDAEANQPPAIQDVWRVTCQGSFELDLAENVATLSDEVEIVSQNNPQDWLQADVIQLDFEGKSPGWFREPPPGEATAPESIRWGVRTISAIGTPARVSLASRQAAAVGDRIAFDIVDQKIRVVGQQNTAQLIHGVYELQVHDIEYQLLDDRTMGPTIVQGPGRLVRGADAGHPRQELSWQTGLVVSQLDQRKSMTLSGDVAASLDPHTLFQADQATIWFTQIPATEEQDRNSTLFPNRLLAHGNVRITSQKMAATVDELRAYWPQRENVPTPTGKVIERPPDESSQAAKTLRQAYTRLQELSPATKDKRIIHVRGKTADLFLNEVGSEQALRELTIDGEVIIRQPDENGTHDALDIRGQRLQLMPQDATHYRMTVSGAAGAGNSLAKVTTPTLTMEAGAIDVDQKANRLWIDGPGRATGAPGENASAAKNTGQLEMDWRGGMIFDGQQIYIEDQVVAQIRQTTPEQLVATTVQCQAINITLNQRMDLAGSESNADSAPQIQLLSIVGEIPQGKRVFRDPPSDEPLAKLALIQRQTVNSSNQLIGRQQLSVPWGQVQLESGDLRTNGPGWVTLWQAGGTPLLTSANETSTEDRPRLTQIKFDDSIVGNIERSDLTFMNNVRVIHGAGDADQTLDADQSSLTDGRIRLRANQLRVTQWQKSGAAASHVEIVASRQAQLEGETFDALAERISYDESQQRLVIEGDARNHAQLTYATTPGGARNPLVATKINYNLQDNTISVEGFKHGVLTTGPILNR